MGALVQDSSSQTDYSLTSLANKIPNVTHLASRLLMGTLQYGFFLTCLVVPVLGVTLCAILFACPLRLRMQYRLLVACEVGQ